MKIVKAAWLYCKTALPALLLATTTQAQQSLDDYYVVELILFTHEADANRQEETWPDDIKLTLPAEEKRAWLADIDIADSYPEVAAAIDAALTPPADSDNRKPAILPDLDVSTAAEKNADNDHAAPAVHFYPLLQDNYSQHQDAAQRIRYSSGKHRLLLHQTWLQKITDKENATDIILQAGDEQYGFHEVAGSIKLFKSRYLHIHTNLWRLQFQPSSKADEKNERPLKLWPAVPEIAMPEPQHSAVSNDRESGEAQADSEQQLTGNQTSLWQTPAGLPALQPDLANVALLQQQRRLRSREIHYIDHPLFGLIIEIRPFELPESAATEEAPAP